MTGAMAKTALLVQKVLLERLARLVHKANKDIPVNEEMYVFIDITKI